MHRVMSMFGAKASEGKTPDDEMVRVSPEERKALETHASYYIRSAVHKPSDPVAGRMAIEPWVQSSTPAQLTYVMHANAPDRSQLMQVVASSDNPAATSQAMGSAVNDIANKLQTNPHNAAQLIPTLMKVANDVCAHRPSCSWKAALSSLDGAMLHSFVKTTRLAVPEEKQAMLETYAGTLRQLAHSLQPMFPEGQTKDLLARADQLLSQSHTEFPSTVTRELDCEDCEEDNDEPFGEDDSEEPSDELAQQKRVARKTMPAMQRRLERSADKMMGVVSRVAVRHGLGRKMDDDQYESGSDLDVVESDVEGSTTRAITYVVEQAPVRGGLTAGVVEIARPMSTESMTKPPPTEWSVENIDLIVGKEDLSESFADPIHAPLEYPMRFRFLWHEYDRLCREVARRQAENRASLGVHAKLELLSVKIMVEEKNVIMAQATIAMDGEEALTGKLKAVKKLIRLNPSPTLASECRQDLIKFATMNGIYRDTSDNMCACLKHPVTGRPIPVLRRLRHSRDTLDVNPSIADHFSTDTSAGDLEILMSLMVQEFPYHRERNLSVHKQVIDLLRTVGNTDEVFGRSRVSQYYTHFKNGILKVKDSKTVEFEFHAMDTVSYVKSVSDMAADNVFCRAYVDSNFVTGDVMRSCVEGVQKYDGLDIRGNLACLKEICTEYLHFGGSKDSTPKHLYSGIDEIAHRQDFDWYSSFMFHVLFGIYGFSDAAPHLRPFRDNFTVGTFLYGVGGTGKSTFGKALQYIRGSEYVCKVTPQAQASFKTDSIRQSHRLVVWEELDRRSLAELGITFFNLVAEGGNVDLTHKYGKNDGNKPVSFWMLTTTNSQRELKLSVEHGFSQYSRRFIGFGFRNELKYIDPSWEGAHLVPTLGIASFKALMAVELYKKYLGGKDMARSAATQLWEMSAEVLQGGNPLRYFITQGCAGGKKLVYHPNVYMPLEDFQLLYSEWLQQGTDSEETKSDDPKRPSSGFRYSLSEFESAATAILKDCAVLMRDTAEDTRVEEEPADLRSLDGLLTFRPYISKGTLPWPPVEGWDGDVTPYIKNDEDEGHAGKRRRIRETRSKGKMKSFVIGVTLDVYLHERGFQPYSLGIVGQDSVYYGVDRDYLAMLQDGPVHVNNATSPPTVHSSDGRQSEDVDDYEEASESSYFESMPEEE